MTAAGDGIIAFGKYQCAKDIRAQKGSIKSALFEPAPLGIAVTTVVIFINLHIKTKRLARDNAC